MKKLDNIEQFLRENKAAFDNAEPNDALWNRVTEALSNYEPKGIESFISDNRSAFDSEVPSLKLWANIESALPQNANIEQFLKENKPQFDTEIPHLRVWTNIEKRLNTLKSGGIVRMNWWRQAAAAIALLVIGASAGVYFSNKTEDKAIVQVAKEVAPDLKEAENFYNQKVESKLTQLVSYNPDPSVMNDLQQIDAIQEELRKELRNAPTSTREEIVRRLIENYQIKLGILERVLNHIEEHRIENQKLQQKNEKI